MLGFVLLGEKLTWKCPILFVISVLTTRFRIQRQCERVLIGWSDRRGYFAGFWLANSSMAYLTCSTTYEPSVDQKWQSVDFIFCHNHQAYYLFHSLFLTNAHLFQHTLTLLLPQLYVSTTNTRVKLIFFSSWQVYFVLSSSVFFLLPSSFSSFLFIYYVFNSLFLPNMHPFSANTHIFFYHRHIFLLLTPGQFSYIPGNRCTYLLLLISSFIQFFFLTLLFRPTLTFFYYTRSVLLLFSFFFYNFFTWLRFYFHGVAEPFLSKVFRALLAQ